MRALVIAPQPFFSPRGTPFSVYYRTLVTTELGVKVDLLTYGQGTDVDIPGVRLYRIPRFTILGPVKTGPSLLKLFLDGFLILWTVGLLLRHRYDFVHAHEEAVFFVRFLAPLFRFKLVYDMHSSLPEQLSNFKFTKSRVLINVFRWLEDTSLRASDGVITICPALADYVNSRIADRRKHLLIENSLFDPIIFANAVKNPSASLASGAQTHFVDADIPKDAQLIVYAGTLEPYQGIGILLDSFKKVSKARPDAFLMIVGGTEQQVKQYSETATKNGVADRCLFTGAVPPEVARHCNRSATVLVSPRLTGMNTPLKIYEQIASGIPLVATNIYAHTQVLDDDTAFLVEPSPDNLARGILEALSSDSQRRKRAENAKELYEQKYSRSAYVGKMQQLLELLK
jgi:glycosyltransferase involved in cell wall biosynthesis